ncbi:protein Fe65 homolog isoform X4 [Macrobrachium nipponense]|uniref:protein Fe65 homolog isoform X4 n=1 Tax=Macrobrachium nipponense TaxID=159736 RepID=UPI0030C7C6B2
MEWDSQEADDLLANTTVDISEYLLDQEESDGDDTPSTQPLLHYPHPNDSEEDGDRTDDDGDDEDYENGVLSFENPNYTLGGSNDPRLDDALNSNNSTATHEGPLDGGLSALDSLYSELDQVCNLTRSSSVRNRRHYAHLDIGSMGVDVATGPVTNLDHADHQNNRSDDKRMVTPEGGEGGGDSGVVTDGGSTSSSNSSQQGRHSPTHIPHMTAEHTQDLYALPVKRPPTQTGSQHSTPTHQPSQQNNQEEKSDPASEDALPAGWEKHEDNDGPYYWHIKSGTITRTPPEPSDTVSAAPLRAERRTKEADQSSGNIAGTVTRSNTSSALSELSDSRPRTAAVDNAYKRRSYPARSDITEGSGGRPIRFAVRSLGWVEIAEEDLTPERSSKAVNRCIVDLSVGRRDVLDVVGCWGDGKDLFMDLDEGSLKLVDPENLTVLNTQPIHTIRVWGVGRDNGRDFAYVARDRASRKHMCHVFRCDTPARTIANTLRDICKKIMIERSLQQNMNKPLDTCVSSGGSGRLTRPTNLPTEHRRLHRHSQIIPPQSFPTPMEEPKKVMRVQYIGLLQVERPSGMEVLNSAIDRVIENNPKPWKNVAVAIAPSTITITNIDDGKQLAECRVRFLSFLGIGRDVKHCAFIMHTAQDQFISYIFHCEPSSGALCKTIEAACKLRYQKCLDAHPGVSRGRGAGTPRSISATLRSVFGSITGRKARSAES